MSQDREDINMGDNVECKVCFNNFDARNSSYEVMGGHWVCGDCVAGHSDAELYEILATQGGEA